MACIYFSVSVNVTVRTEPPDAAVLTASTYIDLVCDHDIENNNGLDIFYTWTGPNGIVNDGVEYTITDQFENSILRIERLSVSRDNNAEYTCSVTAVMGSDTVQYSNSLTLSVQGMLKTVCFKSYL